MKNLLLLFIIMLLSTAAAAKEGLRKNPKELRRQELDKFLKEAWPQSVAKRIDEKDGNNILRKAIVQIGQKVWTEEMVDLSPKEAFNVLIYVDHEYTKAAIPELRDQCKSSKEFCSNVEIMEGILKNSPKCKEEIASACLDLALTYHRLKRFSEAANFAQKACVKNNKSACDLYLQINQEKIAAKKERDQWRLMHATQREMDEDAYLNGPGVPLDTSPLENLSKEWSKPKEKSRRTNCTTTYRTAPDGKLIVDSNCEGN